MAKITIADISADQSSTWMGTAQGMLVKDAALVAGASLLMALCAHVSLPLVFSPVPLTLQTFGVLAIGLTLGSRRGFAALALYLAEGAAGLPVFSPAGPGGIAQMVGPTGGFLMAYPAVAFIAGWIFEQKDWQKIVVSRFGAAVCASMIAEMVLFAGGMSWLKLLTGISLAKAASMAVLPFIPGEILKIAAASAIASKVRRGATHSAKN